MKEFIASVDGGEVGYGYHTLQDVETKADIIVEAVVSEVTGASVARYYGKKFYYTMLTDGYTEKEIKITKVYKGDV